MSTTSTSTQQHREMATETGTCRRGDRHRERHAHP